MQDLTLNFDNKTITNDFLDEEELVIQRVKLAIQCWSGDWFLDGNFGVPYSIRLGSKSMLMADLEEVILSVDGVQDVVDIDLKIVKEDGLKVYKFYVTINTIYKDNTIVDGLIEVVGI